MHVFQRHIGRLLPVAVIGILSACSARFQGAGSAGYAGRGQYRRLRAQGFVVVTPEAPGCGFTLTTAGKLTQDGKTVADPLVASYRQDASGNAAGGRGAGGAVSPLALRPLSASCRPARARGTHAMCWKVFVFDREAGRAEGGRGRQIRAGPLGQAGARTSSMRCWSAAMKGPPGSMSSRPPAASRLLSPTTPRPENWQIQPDTLAWTGPRSFTVTVTRCTGCAAKQETITVFKR